MNPVAAAEQAIRDADPDAALKHLQDGVRANPSDPKLRVFLFQLLSVLGQWDRALNQLNVAAELDASTLAMAQMYREALRCEVLRAEVFSGRRSPLIFGMPQQWLALLIESLLTAGQGDAAHAGQLREAAFEQAPPTSGTLDGEAFDWIADADMRLGPVCEAVINGKYYFVPFEALSRISIEAPEDLRDLVWMPAHFEFTNGGEAVGVIPTRYAGSESDPDPLIRLARKTEWNEPASGVFHGLGQRIFTTDAGDHPLMGIREIRFTPQTTAE
ncbi:type VI secretion system accessory protein TagJ [Niveibacterium umoris]|uniref:Type VI secretion system protein ImpE n=1 Tax=Niveibacterium umoris TaxID=1193620 RepID=A0A840BMC8_9RHOO|nr:type VI secretion system accessory protein TagJ [Niveibacterium umoris]MBB4011647.1 type VI secretion system protein ImpE [Niveibacterium umoris]